MDKTITLEFPAKKLEALSHFLKKKDTTLEADREFLDDTGADGGTSPNF